jgi:L-alanine-DL-glutamate epimerase-like enolase superfamily enzyme
LTRSSSFSHQVPHFEFVSPQIFDSPLRRDLTAPEPLVKDGCVELPSAPGLGISLNEQLIEKLRLA